MQVSYRGISFLTVVLALLVSGPFCNPAMALLASDDASNTTYDDGLQGTDNGGSGFNSWSLSSGGNSGFFVASSTGNGDGDGNSDGDIDNSGRAWGLFANSGDTASAVRGFTTGALDVGNRLSISMDNGFVDSGSTVGFGLQNAAGDNLVEYFFVGGNTNYTVNALSVSGTTPGFTDEGMKLTFTVTDSDSFSLTVDELVDGEGVNHTVTGDFFNNADQRIAQIRFFNANAGFNGSNNLFFNSVTAIPEPSAVLFGGLVCGVLGLSYSRTRNRAA